MSRSELRQAITAPAKQVELALESELVEQIISDVADSPGFLLLLQYTLTELWGQRTGDKLTLAAYTRLGGVKGTLQKRATEVYEGLSGEEQEAAKRIFLELTQLGEGTEDTRRRVLLRDLVASSHVEQVIQKLADARLIVTQEEFVDVAHEALIRHWLLLRKWLDENRDRLREKRKIETAAQEWLDAGKGKDYLFRGLRKTQAEDFKEKNTETFPLSNLAEEFIFESKYTRDGEDIGNFSIQNSSIENIIFNNLHIENCSFENVDFAGANLVKVNIKNASFSNADLLGAYFIGINLINAHIEECDLTGTALIGSSLINSHIEDSKNDNFFQNMEVNFNGCDLRNINLSGCHLCGIVLSQVNLSNANLYEINLRGSNLSGSDLSKSNLNKANLSGTNLSQVNLNKANLSSANLCAANLDNSNLSIANLNQAKLIGAKLNGANLQSCELNDADIMACDFNGAINLTPRQIKVAKNWEYAEYDEEFRKKLGLK